MIVPKFRLQQDDLFVYVTIVVPYIRVGSAELAVTEACRFSFYCSPYLLKLSFSCPIRDSDDTDDGNCKATYDPSKDHGTIIAMLPKLNRGQWFPDLDLTTKLLQIGTGVFKAHPNVGPASIEVMGEISGSQMHRFELEDSSSSCLIAPKNRYGFLSRYSGVFVDLREELQDMLEVKDPESMTASYRRRCRVSVEDMLFDAGRYLADQLEGEADPIFKDAMSLQPFFVVQWDHRTRLKLATSASTTAIDLAAAAQRSLSSDAAFDLAGGFSEEELDALCRLTNREYSVRAGSDEEWALWVGLADLLFAYCYDLRMTGGEPTVESAHNMSRLSLSLSWLEDFSQQSDRHISVSDCIKFSLRRSVIYPYLRVWKLARKVLADVAKLLFLGKRAILKCLLRIRAVFEHTDTHYLLNKLYVDDYCTWIQQQQQQDDTLHGLHVDSLYEFAKEYNSAKSAIEKRSHQGKELMGFNIPALEQWASDSADNRFCPSGETDIEATIPAHLLSYEADSHRLRTPDLRYLLPVAETRQEGQWSSPFLIPGEGAASADNPSAAACSPDGCWLRPVATKRRGVPEQQLSDID